jgi:hypothetical protein
MQDEYKSASGSVIAADFYHSNALMPLSDEAIVGRVQRNLEICEPGFLGAQVCCAVLCCAVHTLSESRNPVSDRAWLCQRALVRSSQCCRSVIL